MSLCFVNLHLNSGTSEISERSNQLDTILLDENFQPFSSDVVFVFGDFNFRLQGLSVEDSLKLITSKTSEMSVVSCAFDEYKAGLCTSRAICQLTELPIKFYPTYKYEINSSNLSSRRAPSWCDRIFSKIQQNINFQLKQVSYKSHQNLKTSDHQPVSGIFTLTMDDAKLELPKKITKIENLISTGLNLKTENPSRKVSDLIEFSSVASEDDEVISPPIITKNVENESSDSDDEKIEKVDKNLSSSSERFFDDFLFVGESSSKTNNMEVELHELFQQNNNK